MSTKAIIGQTAPLLAVSEWVQGGPVFLNELIGQVILVEVFQVNCPGCFLYALPQAIQLYERYHPHGLILLGIATAFEDFDKNTLDNLHRLIDTGEVIGETLSALQQHSFLENGRLPYKIPFPLAMDRLIKRDRSVTEEEINVFISEQLPDFTGQPKTYQERARSQVSDYLSKLSYRAQTFEKYQLKGTPSSILIDKKGILRECAFGQDLNLEAKVRQLLLEA